MELFGRTEWQGFGDSHRSATFLRTDENLITFPYSRRSISCLLFRQERAC